MEDFIKAEPYFLLGGLRVGALYVTYRWVAKLYQSGPN